MVFGFMTVWPGSGGPVGIPSRFATVTDERPSTGPAIPSDQQPSPSSWGALPTPSLGPSSYLRNGIQSCSPSGGSKQTTACGARGLDDVRKTTEKELESLRRRRDRIAELQQDGIIMEQYAGLIPAELESLAPEERHRVYGLLRLQMAPRQDGGVELTGVIGAADGICQSQTTPA